jgi:hypothetical protein
LLDASPAGLVQPKQPSDRYLTAGIGYAEGRVKAAMLVTEVAKIAGVRALLANIKHPGAVIIPCAGRRKAHRGGSHLRGDALFRRAGLISARRA